MHVIYLDISRRGIILLLVFPSYPMIEQKKRPIHSFSNQGEHFQFLIL